MDVGAAAERSRTPGVLFVELHDDHKAGTTQLAALADRVMTAFQRATFDDVTYRTPYIANGSSGERAGKWWRITVACPFYADDIS